MPHRHWRSEGYAKIEDRKLAEFKAWSLEHPDIAFLVKQWKRFENWTFSLSTPMQTSVWVGLLSGAAGLIFFACMHIPPGLINHN